MKCQFLDDAPNVFEIGVDEAGRGPLFGRVYAAAVVLPKDATQFDHSLMKDSKKFSSTQKINEAADYIKSNAIAYAVAFKDETVIDRINILQATQAAMHEAIEQVVDQLQQQQQQQQQQSDVLLLIDGNYFVPFRDVPHHVVIGGDNTYTCIAAASILAKVERDKYIHDLCQQHPDLDIKYHISKNKGYGARVHLDGIRTHGVSPWHRKTFGICKQFGENK